MVWVMAWAYAVDVPVSLLTCVMIFVHLPRASMLYSSAYPRISDGVNGEV